MKKLLLFFLGITLITSYCWAQQEVSGKVTSAKEGVGLPGVAVVVVGTTQGTISDMDGAYKISVPSGASLKFSLIGYQSQEILVGNKSVLDVALADAVTQLNEIVVTALSVERNTKALQYSVSTVSGENFTQARENNLANALEGRVAGLNVTPTATGPAGSSRVIIRGNKSLQGDNQPLYVVDGIPMDNSQFGQAGMWGGSDNGDGMSSINPDDIESISVLKGANAAALYGARAANGVINITTKKGKVRKGIGIEFNSNMIFENVRTEVLDNIQEKYGQGWIDGAGVIHRPTTASEAWNGFYGNWGAKLDGSPQIQWDGKTYPYSLVGMKQNFKDFFQTGSAWTNSIALTGGNEKQNFRVGISKMNNDFVIPHSGFDRTNISLSTNSKFGKKVTLVAKVLYSNEVARNRPYVSDSPGNGVQQIMNYPTNYSVLNSKGDPAKLGAIPANEDPNLLTIWGKVPGEEFQEANNPWGQNPYWAAYQLSIGDIRDRIITSGQLRYDITDWLYIQGTAGLDWYTRRGHNLVAQGTGYQRGGARTEDEQRVNELNLESMLGFNKTFGKINVNAFVGGNNMTRHYEYVGINGNGFNVAFFPAITNSALKTWGYGYDARGINSVFGSAEVGYNNYLFLTATARQDWFSVLNPANNHILYPSVGASFVFSDAFKSLPTWLSFGKVRASWAQVGSVQVGPYSTTMTYSIRGEDHLGKTMASFSSASGSLGTINNPNLKPPTSTEVEVGLDLRFLENRIGLDLSYYNQKTTDDILNATIAPSSGFGSTLVNVGELQNQGIEVLLTGSPVKGAFTWDVSLNLAHNANKVISLIAGQDELVVEEPRTRNVYIKHVVGHPFGMITGREQAKDPQGNLIYFADGRPVVTPDYQLLGNGIPDWTGGLENSFTFKNFNLSFLIDFKFGGDIFSGTNQRLTGSGDTKLSLQGRTGEAPLHVKGVVNTGTDEAPVYTPIDRDLTPLEAANYWWAQDGETTGAPRTFMYDASFAKLRQLTFGYNFPRSLLAKTPIQNLSLSFVARNLLVLFKHTPNIDPEPAYTNSNGQGMDYYGMPPTRTYGFNLRATF